MLSFEFFPTRSDEAECTLLEKTIPALRELCPDFCSVTYGAGGGTRGKTLAIVDRIQREQQITCRYAGHYREICPHIIGWTDGEEMLLGWQFGGETSSTLPPTATSTASS